MDVGSIPTTSTNKNGNMKDDYKFVKRVLENKDNKMVHYPAIKQLIKNFYLKWKRMDADPVTLMRYEYHLKSLLWYTFTTSKYTDQ
tara:strand:+ start:74 stop:331 length:258 start_codon:yes stop_codon:yes gene_type:complete